ncbi:MAG: MlaD family protein, partial [Pseudomonadota bacterium]
VSVGSPVLYNGIDVGKIIDLELNPDDLREVIVTIEVDSSVPLREDTEAGLRMLGVTGLAAIQLSGGAPDSPLLQHRSNRAPPELATRESPLQSLMESSEGIFLTANNILLQMQKLLSDENIDQVEQTLASIREFSDTLSEQREQFASLMLQANQAGTRLNTMLGSADATLNDIKRVIGQVDEQLMDALPSLIEGVETSLENIASMSSRADTILASNQESLMHLGQNGLNQIGPGLEELRDLLRELSVIAESLGEDPSNFLLGGDDAEEYRP